MLQEVKVTDVKGASLENPSLNTQEVRKPLGQHDKDHEISAIGKEILLDDDEEKGCCCFKYHKKDPGAIVFMKLADPVFRFSNSIASLGASVASAITLAFLLRGSSSPVPAIVTLVVAGCSNVLTLSKEGFDFWKDKENQKQATQKEIARNKLEEERHEELAGLIVKATTSIENYKTTRDKEVYAESMQTIKKIPQGPKGSATTRDALLFKLIQVSGDDESFKSTFDELAHLMSNIQDIENAPQQRPSLSSTAKQGEGNAAHGNMREAVLADQLSAFQKKWRELEEANNCTFDSLPINGVFYDRDGNVLRSNNLLLPVIQEITRHNDLVVKAKEAI